LPGDTRVFCAHEYTENNGRFARTVEPSNPDLVQHLDRIARLRANGEPTVPSRMDLECKANPFLRPDSAEIRQSLHMDVTTTDLDVFARLRSLKDHF
jgi:hydroxyacylglutathione hydrolase